MQYFKIVVTAKTNHEYGPYVSLQEAATILMDHIPFLVQEPKEAKITEYILDNFQLIEIAERIKEEYIYGVNL